jgi:hypothetical protein
MVLKEFRDTKVRQKSARKDMPARSLARDVAVLQMRMLMVMLTKVGSQVERHVAF